MKTFSEFRINKTKNPALKTGFYYLLGQLIF